MKSLAASWLCAAPVLVALVWSMELGVAHALDVPPLAAHVNDYARVLPQERASALEAKLAAYEQSSGQQFALLTVDSLQGDALETFAIRVAEQWKLGNAKRDDGLVLIVVPKERKLRIEVGYGLEGTVPDAVAARVIREIMTPAFQRGDYAGGTEAAFDALIRAASGQAPPQAAPTTQPQRGVARSPLALLGPLLFFALIMLMSRGGRRGRGGMMWLGPLIGAGMGGLGGGRRGGGGGGFRGGGGGFGGGGASGGW
jgi:uncharacterized protein